jgi:phospholipid transport system substrate-binding protein
MMKRWLYPVMFFLLTSSLIAAAAVARDAETLVKTTADKVIARVKQDKATLRADPHKLNALVDDLVIPHFDFVRMSQWVLGKHWRTADKDQQMQFVEEFKKLLVRTYATALLEYSDRKINYFPVHEEADGDTVTVKTEAVQSASTKVPINYRMHVKDNGWKVYDVSVDGISLVSTYRNTFNSEIKKNGIAGLIQDLVKKNAKKSR